MGMKLPSLLVLALLIAAACGDDDGAADSGDGDVAEVKIAGLFAQSGELASIDLDGYYGAQLAIAEINETGGFEVAGTTYTFDFEATDLQSDPNVATQAAQNAIDGFGADYLLGSSLSALAESIATQVLRHGDVLQLGAATILDEFAGQGDPIFRTLIDDERTAEQYIPVLREQFPDVEEIGALMINDTIGQSILDIYPPGFEANDFDVLSSETFPPDETNFAPLLQRVPGDVGGFFIGYTDEVSISIAEAAIEAGLPTILFNRGGACQPGVELGERIDAYTCIIYTEDPFNPTTDEAQAFFDTYLEEFDLELNSNAAQALYYYDHVYMLVEAMQQAGTVDDVEAVADAIRGITYDGIIEVAYDDDGRNLMPIKVGIVEQGEVRVEEGAAS